MKTTFPDRLEDVPANCQRTKEKPSSFGGLAQTLQPSRLHKRISALPRLGGGFETCGMGRCVAHLFLLGKNPTLK